MQPIQADKTIFLRSLRARLVTTSTRKNQHHNSFIGLTQNYPS